MKCKIVFERVKEIGNCLTAFGILWFPAGLFLLWISDYSYKNYDLVLICVMQCVNSVFLCISVCLTFCLPMCYVFPALTEIPHTHRESLADFYVSIEV